MPLTIDQQLASADAFAVLASSTVTNSGATVIQGGNLGLFPGTSITGFPPGVVAPPAVTHATDQVANQAEIDAMSAYNHFQSLPPGTIISELAGQTLTPGTYTALSSLDLSVGGVLTLSGNGNFIFQIGSTLTINVGASILLTNGAQAKNVIFVAGSSITIGTSAVAVGDMVALASVSLGTGASLNGRAIGLTGAVTLLDNAITMPSSSALPVTLSSGTASATLSEICFPDITGKAIRAWGLVTISPGGYTVGGIPFGLVAFLDARTVDFNAFLKCDVYGEDPLNTTTVSIEYHYSPTNDSLQILFQGVELLAGQTVPAAILADQLLFEAWVDRTSVRG